MKSSLKSPLAAVAAILATTSITLTLGACGSSDATTAAISDLNALAAAMPTIAVTSPTAASSSGSARLQFQRKSTLVARTQYHLGRLLMPSVVADATSTETIKPVGEMLDELKEDIAAADPTAMAAKIGNFSITQGHALCYGPGWQDNATGSNTNRPTGDLGLVYATASATDTTACAAAELNALVAGAPQFVNKIIKLQATLVIALNKAGKELPAVGASLDGLALLPTLSGVTLTAATIERLADDANAYPVYKTKFEFTTNIGSGEATVFHSPKDAENVNFKGLVQAILPHSSAMGQATGTKRGLSMVYDQSDGVLSYALDTAANRSTASSDFFSTSTGRIDYSKAGFGEDAHKILASFNQNTNQATMHYAWQAGSQDGAVRAFAVGIGAGTAGSLTGVGYFGFGDAVSAVTDTTSTLWAEGMFCNWLDFQGRTLLAEVQGQTFAQNATTSVFEVVTNKINFKPVNSCTGADYTVSNAQAAGGSASGSVTFLNGTRSGTKDLTTPQALGTVPEVVAPTYTLPSS
jgi:hypothetical protein